MMAVLLTVLFIILWVVASVAMVALPTLVMMRRLTGTAEPTRATSVSPGPMSRSAEHDIDDLLDAINEHRRRAGHRDIGEELADELMRSTWDDRV
jgi:hypothetical protein